MDRYKQVTTNLSVLVHIYYSIDIFPIISLQWILLLVMSLLLFRIFLHRIVLIYFPIRHNMPQHSINTLQYSYLYHLSIVLLITINVHWNSFDLTLWIVSYICLGMVRKTIYTINIQKQLVLNDYSYNNQILLILSSSRIFGLLLSLFTILYFLWVHYVFVGISMCIKCLLLFPTIMLGIDSIFLFLNSTIIYHNLLCYFNPNINQIPPTYKLEMFRNILSSCIRLQHYYTLIQLFFKTFLDRMEIFDCMWILSIANAFYLSVSTLISSINNYRSYDKLLKKINVIFTDNPSVPQSVCMICMQQLLNCRRLAQCGHLFHYKCLFQWIQTKQDCPICRVKIDL